MFNENAGPDVLDALLDYLAEHLPSSVYNILLSIISRSLVFLSSSLSFITSLLSTHPSDWNLHNIIPPLVTLLCAYLALVTIYRTTTWAIRTMFWFIKWGLLLGFIFMTMGWYLGVADQNWGATLDIRDKIIRAALDSVNAHIPEAADGGMNVNSRMHGKQKTTRPRPWDSFESHQRWLEHNQQDATNKIDFLRSVVKMADGILQQGGQWWMVAKSTVSEAQGERAAEQRKQDFKGKTKSRSR